MAVANPQVGDWLCDVKGKNSAEIVAVDREKGVVTIRRVNNFGKPYGRPFKLTINFLSSPHCGWSHA